MRDGSGEIIEHTGHECEALGPASLGEVCSGGHHLGVIRIEIPAIPVPDHAMVSAQVS